MTVWCNPPPVYPNRWRTRLAPLMDRPGDWALVETHFAAHRAEVHASELRTRCKIPPGRWEFRTGRIEDQVAWGVWARYLGEDL